MLSVLLRFCFGVGVPAPRVRAAEPEDPALLSLYGVGERRHALRRHRHHQPYRVWP